MMTYISLCIISILTGRGILKLLRIPLGFSTSLYLSPIITLAGWTLFLGWGIILGFPVKNLWFTGYIITLLFSIVGCFAFLISLRNRDLPKNLYLLPIVIFIPIIAMAPYFSHGLFNYGGADAPDGWSYIAVGQYLWENIRGAEGQLIPLHQYAAHLVHARFIAAALLGFLSPLTGHAGDTQITANVFCAWCLFNLASACAFFATTQKNIKFIAFYLLLVIYSGWVLGLLAVNNFDNALILSVLPTLAGIANLISKNKFKWLAVIALLLAMSLFCYVELAPFILMGTIIFFIQPLWIHTHKREFVISILIVAVFTFILILPYAKENLTFFYNQVNNSINNSGTRLGEGFFPFLHQHQFIGFWGFTHHNLNLLCLSLILLYLATLGLRQLWITKQRALALFGVLLSLAYLNMIFRWHYAYGAYKFNLLNWWLISYCIILGINTIFARPSHKYKTLILIGLSVLSIDYLMQNYAIQRTYAKTVTIKNIQPYRKLSDIKQYIDDHALLVTIDNNLANEWAVYFLKDYPIKLTEYKLYMAQPHVVPYMLRAKTIAPNDITFLLTDNSTALPKQNLIWTSGPYYLWKLPKKPFPSSRLN